MKALVLGMGLQGKAVVHDLERSSIIKSIVAADMHTAPIEDYVKEKKYHKTKVVKLDASDEQKLSELVTEAEADILVCMLPVILAPMAAKAALHAGIHFVSSNYTSPEIADLHEEALAKGITILPEMGLDPGIDLALGKLALDEFDEVHGFNSYGSGIPEPECADDNPLHYKITWTFDGVLKAYKRDGYIIRGGKEVFVSGKDMFQDEYTHTVEVEGLGTLEAYPNGDATKYLQKFNLGKEVQEMGRYALRYPGHCQLWNSIKELGLLSDTPIDVGGGVEISPHDFIVKHFTPQLQYTRSERDIAFLRVKAWGLKNGKKHKVLYDLLDYRNLDSGLFAMNRTVGFTSSIGAQMILSGKVSKRGVLSPITDVPAKDLLKELERTGMKARRFAIDEWDALN